MGFKQWYEEKHGEYPGSLYEHISDVMLRLADAYAEYVDEITGQKPEQKVLSAEEWVKENKKEYMKDYQLLGPQLNDRYAIDAYKAGAENERLLYAELMELVEEYANSRINENPPNFMERLLNANDKIKEHNASIQ